jgi:nicotinate-nucleotide adenylyltransferase
MARLAQRALHLEEVLFVPCARQPLKSKGPEADAGHRCAMVALAIQGRPSWRLDTREVARGGTSYTVDTLAALRAERPRDELVLILGQDSLESLPRWKAARRIPALAHLAVVLRDPGRSTAPPAFTAGAVTVLPAAPLVVSATEIRRSIAGRGPWERLVPAPVARYIRRQGLYGSRRSP